ncbi:hypothetical protein lbkm_2640 [Lachnospiraceae bacterium KM106-2]|nr:hypothetical protein lbkm_2640 [Lachnospiraceae bacterium KM106-2]
MTCEERIYSNDYIDIITEFEPTEDILGQFTDDYCYQPIDQFGFFSASREDIPIYNVSTYGYVNVPKVFVPLQNNIEFNTFNLNEAGIIVAQNAPLNLTGRGVVVGIIDAGIDYTNPVFRNQDGTTRILGLWDQTSREGVPPEGMLYGTEYKTEQINEALQSENPYSIVPSRDESGHGTAVASVICGSRLNEGETFFGAAPDTQIAVVKLKQAKQYLKEYYLVNDDVECYQETDILTALAYLDSFATALSRPLVICITLGSNLGGHTGDSILSLYLGLIGERKSRAIVVAGGNEGLAAHHYRGELTSSKTREVIEVNVDENVNGFMIEFWGDPPALFTMSVRSPLGELSPPASLRATQRQTFRFVFRDSVVTFDTLTIEQSTGKLLIELRITNPPAGVWQINVTGLGGSIGGTFNLYLPNSELLSGKVEFLKPDPLSTLTAPSYVSSAITVVSYDSITRSVSPESGRGYGLRGEIKPDVAVPGVNVPSIVGIRSGTSFSAAIAAGGIAQFFQWAVAEKNDILVDSNDIRSYLIRGAIRDIELMYPNENWGYGRYNLIGVFNYLATIE